MRDSALKCEQCTIHFAKREFSYTSFGKCWSVNIMYCSYVWRNKRFSVYMQHHLRRPHSINNIFAIGNVNNSVVCIKKNKHFGLVCWTFLCINRTLYVQSILFTITRGSHSTEDVISFFGGFSQTAIYIS